MFILLVLCHLFWLSYADSTTSQTCFSLIGRATEARDYAERLIQDAILYGPKHIRTMELASFWIKEKQLVHKLFKVFVPRLQNETTGFTKVRFHFYYLLLTDNSVRLNCLMWFFDVEKGEKAYTCFTYRCGFCPIRQDQMRSHSKGRVLTIRITGSR